MNTDEFYRYLWRGKADAYQRSFASLCAHPMAQLLDALAVSDGCSVLDVGCGTGGLSQLALARGAAVTAVDAEPSMVAATGRRVPGAAASVAALPQLPFSDDTFDAVAANFVVNHVGQPARAVAELARVTRRGGRVGITIWPRPQRPLQQLWDDVLDVAGAVRPALPRVAREDDFARTTDGLRQLLTGAGLTDVQAEILEWEHCVDADAWWVGATEGIATIGHIVSRQSEATVLRMKSAYDRLVQPHRDSLGMLRLPTAALLAVGIAS